MSRVFFDLGNTRIKWWREQGVPERGAFNYDDMAPELEMISRGGNAPVEAVFASVVRDVRLQQFIEALHRQGFGRLSSCVVTPEELGVRCAYEDIGRLGIDRWLAVVAGWQKVQSAVVVVDLGTAATLDFVDASGQHLGGYILPGLRLGVTALLQGTSNVLVDFDKLKAGGTAPGRNTTDAVYHGALYAMKSVVENGFHWLRKTDSAAKLLITGGDADLVATCLECQYEKVDDLVFAGMRLLADANRVVVERA